MMAAVCIEHYCRAAALHFTMHSQPAHQMRRCFLFFLYQSLLISIEPLSRLLQEKCWGV